MAVAVVSIFPYIFFLYDFILQGKPGPGYYDGEEKKKLNVHGEFFSSGVVYNECKKNAQNIILMMIVSNAHYFSVTGASWFACRVQFIGIA